MSEERSKLEQALLRDPFATELRERYAELLYEQREFAASLAQWELVLRQGRDSAQLRLRAAECARACGHSDTEVRHIEAARAFGESGREPAGPEPDQDAPIPPQRLRIVAGGRAEEPRAEILSFSSPERVRFADIVGMEDLKKTVRLRIVEPFARPGLFQRFRKQSGGGVLLYGPPGCGKTLMARAIATECGASFTAVGISDVLNMWIGETEQNLVAIFEKARADAPSVLFFDELDALAFARSKAQSEHTRTRVNEFLGQLDGMAGRNDRVLILGATNMPWDVDDAMKRPGRFDRQIFVPPPDAAARAEMFRIKLQGVPAEPFDAERLGACSEHFSGADIDGAIELAKEAVLGDILDSGEERPLTERDLRAAIESMTASTLEWLKTARNLVKYGGAGRSYRDVEQYLRSAKLY